MLDVDRFKLYNDTYGHAAGDDCLRQIGAVVRENVLHPADIAARYGGEELAIVLSDTDAVQAAVVAERIRARVEALGLQHAGNPPTKRVTLSIGATTCVPEASSSTTCQSLLLEADKALYVAKSSGRNKCISASQSPDRRRAKAACSA
jgi:diguanylate cyclase (GGDEF)-like protein